MIKKHKLIAFFVMAFFLFMSCNNNYLHKTKQVVPVTGIALTPNKDNISLVADTNRKIEAHVIPDNATDKKLTYTSDNAEIASVNADGLITAKAVGSANITIKAADGVSKTIKITVTAAHIAVTSIVLSPEENTVSLVKGTSRQLTAQVKPENATDKTLTFSSSDNSIASVNAEGLITAHKIGEAVITIQAAGNVSKAVKVNVTAAPVAVTDIVFDPALPANPLPLSVGGTYPLHAKAQPENATDKKLTYTSDNAEIASVNADGLITAKAVGSANITIKASNGVSKEITVTVTTAHIPVTGIAITSGETAISVENKASHQIYAYVVPANATNPRLLYDSSDSEVASVSDDGLIRTYSVGSATITIIAADNPALSKKVTLTVTPATVRVTSIEFEDGQPADPVELTIGEEYKLKLKVIPEDATNKTLIITSSNDDIVWPTGDGNRSIKAYHDVGEATVTITSADNSSVIRTVRFKTKEKTTDPSISIDNPTISYGSDEADVTFTVKTLNGKLNYTPVVVGGGEEWVNFVSNDDTNPAEDTVRLHLKKNKTVWNRTAYIKFKDNNTNEYIISAGKHLEVTLTQKKNETPNVTIRWVHGITPPNEDEKHQVEIQGSNPPTYCEIPHVFYWYEAEHTKFFNTRKMNPTGSPAGGHFDSNQCWAKTSSNMLHWWFEQNESNVNRYIAKKGITKENNPAMYEMYKPVYTRGLPDDQENIKSSIANEFRTKCGNSPQGSYIRNGLRWYLFGLKNFAKDKNYSPELFKDIFGVEEENNPIETKGIYTRQEFNDVLKKALASDSKKAVGINIHGDATYGHAITLWGAAFDEEENVIAIYVCDNNFKPNRVFTYGIYYQKDIYIDADGNVPYLIHYANNFYDKKKHVGEITTLDKGDAQWQRWIDANQ